MSKAYRDLNRALLLLLLFSAAWTSLAYVVSTVLNIRVAVCASRVWLGIPCPLCGMTRGMVSLLHGDFARACQWNPLTPTAAAILALELLYRGAGSRDGGARVLMRYRALDARVHLLGLAAFLVYAAVFYVRQCWS